MTNKQLAGARKAQNMFPDLVFSVTPEGIRVGGVDVPIARHMSADDVFRALKAAAVSQS